MVRTQIYPDERQKAAFRRLGASQKAGLSDLIRQAIDEFLGKTPPSFEEALNESFGMWRARKDISAPQCVYAGLRHLGSQTKLWIDDKEP